MVFVKPGDHPELDALLQKLRADCDDNDPLYVDYAKRQRALPLARVEADMVPGTEAKRGAEAVRAPRAAVRARWLALAALAIVAPVAALALVVLGRGREAGTATPAISGVDTVTFAGADAGAGAVTDTSAVTGAATDAATVTDAETVAVTVSEPAALASSAAGDARAKVAIATPSAATRRPQGAEENVPPSARMTASSARPRAAPSAKTSPAAAPEPRVRSGAVKIEASSVEF